MLKKRHFIAAQDGFALPVAIMVLFVILSLTAAAVAVSVQTNSTTRRDDNVKAALAAAEAGAQTAAYRLNMLHPKEQEKFCVGQSSVEAAGTNGYCKEATGELGNKASYVYWTSEALGAGSSCVGQTVTSQESLIQRCVVAEGTVNGVKRRVSERVASFTAAPLFPVAGVIGLEKVVIENNGIDKGSAGSNGKVVIKNNAEVTESVILGPGGKVEVSNNGKDKGVFERSTSEGKLTLDSKDFGNTATENKDYLITNYLNYEKNKESKLPAEYDEAKGVEFNSTTRKLSMSNNAHLILHEGTYNFCSFEAQNNAIVELAAGAKVVIYIDSASRAESGCPKTGSGSLRSGTTRRSATRQKIRPRS